MEYVKPSTKVSRLNIATKLLAGSYISQTWGDNGLNISIKNSGSTKKGGNNDEQEGGGYMLSRSRTYFN